MKVKKLRRNRTVGLLALFSLLYVLCMGLRVWYFARAGRSMICEADALEQHINALYAYGKWLRGIWYTLLHEHRLAFQNYSFGIGLGADFYTGMQYYAVGEPLNLPVAFLPSSAVFYWFQFLILFRPYLAGLSFLALCVYRERSAPLSFAGMSAGALLYAFSGTTLFIGMWNPFFVIPMITMPLLVRGTDILLSEKRRASFIFAVFLAGVSNFYFFYMQVIFLLGYFVLRIVFDGGVSAADAEEKERAGWRGTALSLLRLLTSGALGVCMSGALLLPMFFALLGNPRAGGHALPVLYEGKYYLELLKNLALYIYHPLYDTELALTPLIYPVLALTVIFAKRWGLRRERAELGLLVLMLLIPAAGYVMSGFAYAINRWCWCFALLAAWLTAAGWNRWLAGKLRSTGGLAAAAFLILLNIYLADAPERGNLPNGFAERTTGQEFLDRMTLTEVNALRQTVLPQSDGFARYAGRHLVWNAALLHGVSSTQFYWSLANGAVADLFAELAVNDMANYSYLGFDDRMLLNELAGVTHYTLRFDTPEEQRYVPAGFVRAADYYNFAIYENPLPVGLGTVYARVMPRSEYLTLNACGREEAMVRAAVLSDADAGRAEAAGAALADAASLPSSAILLSCAVEPQDGVIWEPAAQGGGRFVVSGENGGSAGLLLTAEGALPDACEEGIFLGGLAVEGLKDIVNIGVRAYCDVPAEGFMAGAAEDVGAAAIQKTISYKTPESEFYSGWHDYFVNFGSAASPFSAAVLDFPAPGIYTVEEISAAARPAAILSDAAEELAAHAVQEADLHRNPVSLMTDRVTFTASAPESGTGVLVVTVPWERGWRAFVDGERTPLMRANTAFLGLVLPPGAHEIELRYRTPGLAAGLFVSLLGIAVFVWLAAREGK